MNQITLQFKNPKIDQQHFSGIENRNIEYLEKKYKMRIDFKTDTIILRSEDDLEEAARMVELMLIASNNYTHLDVPELDYLSDLVKQHKDDRFQEMMKDTLTRTFTGKLVRAKTLGQKVFIDAMKSHDLTFAMGPAGTGKTYLAICYAVEMLKKNEVSKIILTRPAVEAGENLGFLPGDLKEKVDPYLRPLYDGLDDMLSAERTQRYIEKGVIEIAPLAYMRGRTLDEAIIILDEAQNTTKAQMLMFLSRLGRNSKMIVTGDLSQIDLPKQELSGLEVAKKYLKGLDAIAMVELSAMDVVRHPLVIKILKRFAEHQSR